jgi:hypothetical protein
MASGTDVATETSARDTLERGVRVLKGFSTMFTAADGTMSFLSFRQGEIIVDPTIARWLLKNCRYVVPVGNETAITCPNCHAQCDTERDATVVAVVCRDASVVVEIGSPQFHSFRIGDVVTRGPMLAALEAAGVPTEIGRGVQCSACGFKFH